MQIFDEPRTQSSVIMPKLKSIHLFVILTLFSCLHNDADINVSLIPYPDVLESKNKWSLVNEIRISNDQGINRLVLKSYQNAMFKGIPVKIESAGNINITLDKNLDLNGGFKLTVNKSSIDISISEHEGLYQALSRLNQLYVLNKGKLPQCKINDSPRFEYRGMHLDVGRHFFNVNDIKKYIDFIAFYGYNTFHWHLTEDQGWRIEIKKYPLLQTVAAYRDETLVGHYNDQPHQFDGEKYGGYYTQEEVKEIVEYATSNGVEVIPEIEMPGHSVAALAAYPELGCESKEYKVGTKWGVYDDIYCPSEQTFQFLQDVLDEVITLFPSSYIHIGGDEAPKTAWKNSAFCQQLIKDQGLKDEHGLQSYFIKRIESYLNSKGKKIIGWDEILEGGLAPNATVMSWRGIEGGIEAANANHNVIMTPTSHCYFDYYQSDHPEEPLAIGGLLPVKKVYAYDPIPENLAIDKHKYIIGAQGNLWTEYIKDMDKVEYMVLARMAALSEVLWMERAYKDYERFSTSLFDHVNFWKSKNVNMANHLLDVKASVSVDDYQGSRMKFEDIPANAKLMVSPPGEDEWIELSDDHFNLSDLGEYKFKAIMDDLEGREQIVNYLPHLGTNSKVELLSLPSPRYSGNGPSSLINGIKGSDEKYGDSEWLGFEGSDVEAIFQFEELKPISSVSFRFFKGEGQWIYLPEKVSLFSSEDGEKFTLLKTVENITATSKIGEAKIITEGLQSKYLKVVIENFGEIPAGRQGGGHRAWLFVDEITIQ